MKNFLLPLTLVFVSFYTSAQVTGDYRSNNNNFNWDSDANWQRWNGTAWVAPTAAQGYPGESGTSIAGTVTIQTGHTVTANVDVTANDIGNLVIVGTLVENNNNYDIDMTGSLTITGTYDINGDNCTVDVGGSVSISGAGVLNFDDNDIRMGVTGSFSISGTGAFNLNDDNLRVDIGGNLSILGSAILNMNGNGDDQDINVIGNFLMDGTSQILGTSSNNVLQIGDPTANPASTSTFTIPLTATNVRIAGVTLTVQGATNVLGTMTLNNNNGTKTFRGRVTVSGSWTSTALTSNNRLVFGGEVITSGVFNCGCN